MAVQISHAVQTEPDVSSLKLIPQLAINELPRPADERFLIQSPYTDAEHLLDLETLDKENALLARALTTLRATRPDYATAPYNESFNWEEVISELRRLVKESGQAYEPTSFYVVAFRSQIKPSTDYSHLGSLDKAAHQEAVESGGFLKYVFLADMTMEMGRANKITPGTGSAAPTRSFEIWRLAYGDRERTPSPVAVVPRIRRRRDQPGPSTRTGRSTSIA